MENKKAKTLGLIYLKCSPEIMKKRILERGMNEGRNDDNEQVF